MKRSARLTQHGTDGHIRSKFLSERVRERGRVGESVCECECECECDRECECECECECESESERERERERRLKRFFEEEL